MFESGSGAFSVGSGESITYAIHATTHPDAHFVGTSSPHTLHGTATCENLRSCDQPGEIVGSECNVTQSTSGVILRGFCYSAADATLQCGRTLEVDNQLGSNPRKVPGTGRCPAGTPLSHAGRVVTRRLLIGGCMVSNDANYKPLADVHVPADCAIPSMLVTGCLFPGARNYAPGAVQSGMCDYATIGCTSSTALNYNPAATIDDWCVEPTFGCTLQTAGYAGVDASTEGYQNRHVGLPTPSAGTVDWPTYGNVKVHDANATVLSGCEVIIEGCMDPAAINYESRANQQSHTWCAPARAHARTCA